MAEKREHMEQLSPVKRALLEIRELRARLGELEQERRAPIAVIGLGCRFPGGADDPEAYWRLLRDGIDAVSEVPPERWGLEGLYDPDPDAPGKIATRHGGFLAFERLADFDARFFAISPREALTLDPQQRLLMEVAWEALEHAGQPGDGLVGSRTGVFVGISASDYMQRVSRDRSAIDAYLATGNTHSVASGRLSYLFGLQGPSLSVDTACSSSLVAVHLACQSLRRGECRMALAGGVNVILWPEGTVALSKARMMAPDGRCKAFDTRADGFVRSEGCGIVVLKLFSDALADGDRILAVIRGMAINQDGRSSGLTAPNGPSQEAVIRDALADGGVSPAEISYAETHGTGTALGDPIEAQALGAVLREGRDPSRPVMIGSVKTNLGHLESAAGVAGLIKVILALQEGEIPPHLHFKEPSPYIPWADLPIVVAAGRTPWPRGNRRRLAGVSSFGFSGTNAHVVVEEAPEPRPAASGPERPLHLLTLSAKSDRALAALAGRWEHRLAEEPEICLANMAFTANAGRAHFPHRAAFVAASREDTGIRLRQLAAGEDVPEILRGEAYATTPPEVAFLFTGHGAQYPGMGRELYETSPTFKAALDRCAAILTGQMDRPLLDVLFGEAGLLEEMGCAQPALFALQWALAELWRSWGIAPTVVMGHSAGEFAAATVAGVLSLEDGLRLIAARGRLMQGLPRDGAMVSLLASETRAREAIAPYGGDISIAALNGPESVVLSGRRVALEEVARSLEAAGVKTKTLAVPVASHSPLMEPLLDAFEGVAAEMHYQPPRLGLVSNLTGHLVQPGEIDARYWRRHLREPVRFQAGMEALGEQGCTLFVELGPHPVLLGMGPLCLPEGTGAWLPSLRRDRGAWEQLLESLGSLYVPGIPVDWVGFDRDYPRRKVSLPTYPFQRERYWIEAAPVLSPEGDGAPWGPAVAAGERQAGDAPLDLLVATYPAKWAALDRLALAYILHTLRSIGAFARPGAMETVDTVLAVGRVQSAYRPLIKRWLDSLVAEGVLNRHDDGFQSPRPLPQPDLGCVWSGARETLADLPFLIAYVERCGEKLLAVLRGQESPLETLFPGGSFETADYLYHRWAMTRYFNSILGAVAESAVQSFLPGRTVRVLEVGAGTGGTTAALLPRLPATCTHYEFTDTSELFLSRAAERFAAFPFVSYGILDIEKSPQGQGYPAHEYDLVIAANVLHATRDLGESLDNVLSMLGPEGLLLLFETTSHPRWFDVTFGLIEGWHRYADAHRRDNPLLDKEGWVEALRSRGFQKVSVLPEAGSPAETLIAHAIVAQAPALIGTASQAQLSRTAAQPWKGCPAATPGPDQTVRDRLKGVPPGQRRELLVEHVGREITWVLRLNGGQPPDPRHRLMDFGVDSLMAIEFRNRLQKTLGLVQTLPATLIFDYPTVEAIAGYLDRELFGQGEKATRTAEAAAAATVAMDLEHMSEEETEALLLKRLESIEG